MVRIAAEKMLNKAKFRAVVKKALQDDNHLSHIDTHELVLENSRAQVTLENGHVRTVSQETMNFLISLTESNMKELYADSWGWDKAKKIKELTHSKAFYIIARLEDQTPIAFLHYRFELDDYDVETVLYCYEIQVLEEKQGLGLGKLLMHAFEKIAEHFDLRYMMLTCLKINKQAEAFYRNALKYTTDVSDPNAKDYVILSKELSSEWESE